ncbi:MAG TPA: T9SS type A sorting domain-containing protein [Bacteroidia bacterium]|nr:T9SS type A sorting domain-containing protein [Bacteroidia bacterium]
MKNIYSLCLIILFYTASFAQTNIGALNRLAPNFNGNNINDRAQISLYIDYSYLNNDQTSTRWSLNDYYTANDSAINFIGVAYDNICGYYDYVNYANTVVNAADLGLSSIYPADALLRFDSVQAFVAHENNSGVADTIIAELRELNQNNSISSNVLWADSLITNTGLSQGNTWSNGINSFFFMRFPIGYSTTAGQKAGVVFRYLNHNKLDTFGLAAGYIPFSIGGASAIQSTFKNSFLRFPPFAPNISKNSDFLIVSGGYLAGQNWVIIPRVEVYNTSLGLLSSKGDLSVLTVYPNPVNQLLNLEFVSEQNSSIFIQIADAQGNIVFKEEKWNATGIHVKHQIDCSDLSAGLYFVTMQQNNKIYSQRIVVASK